MKSNLVNIHTTYGLITVELVSGSLDLTVRNFVQYVEDGFYDNTIIHRSVHKFVIQGGAYEPGMIRKTTMLPIRNESANGIGNRRGTIAMARLQDDPDSATAEFFVNVQDNYSLNYDGVNGNAGYCAFGRVIDGMNIVERIAGVATTKVGDLLNVPMQQIEIKKMELTRRP